jgi:hypothetical protein
MVCSQPREPARNKLTEARGPMRISGMIGRIALAASLLLTPCMLASGRAFAQDVPGIEICTVEKTMERRTSCLQSNVDFLQKTIAKLAGDHQQKLDAANRQLEALKSTVVALQKTVDELQAAQRKTAEDPNKKPAALPGLKENPPPTKEPVKDSGK